MGSAAGAIVFGASSGLGAATARRLARGGARVVIADLDAPGGERVAAEIGGSAVVADVTDPDAVEAAVRTAADVPGGLRLSVNCAGIATPSKLLGREGAVPLETFAKVLAVNLLSRELLPIHTGRKRFIM